MRRAATRACGCVALVACDLVSQGRAIAADSAEAQAPAAPRRVVELSSVGTLDTAQRAALEALLEPELLRVGLSLVWSAAPATRERLAHASADRQTLMLAMLDVRDRGSWKLVVVDVQRRRAAERTLPAPGRNAAAAEGVASIVASAAAALREGLEVASANADDVLGASPAADSPTPSSSNPRSAETPAPTTPATLQASPSLGGAVATLADDVPAQLGIAASVGVTWSQIATVRLGAAWYDPAHFFSPFGSFRLERESLSLSAARRWTAGPLAAELGVGVCGELLRRAGVQPGVSVDARGGSSVTRTGGIVLARGSVEITHQIAIAVVT